MTIKQASDALQNKQISAVELTKGLLNRIEDKEQSVSALNAVCVDSALKEAEASDERRANGGPKSMFDGIPAIIKDNICTKGIKTSCSSKTFSIFRKILSNEPKADKSLITLVDSTLFWYKVTIFKNNSCHSKLGKIKKRNKHIKLK